MSVPGDYNNYDFDILSKISESLSHIYTSSDPSTQDITVENLVLKSLSSAKHAGMLPGQMTDKIEETIKKFKDRSIRQLSSDEFSFLQSTLSQNPLDSDSGIGSFPSSEQSSRAPSPMLSEAKKTSSWIEDLFPTHGLFLPSFSSLETQAPILSKQESALLMKVLKENGFDSIADYKASLESAKKACPSSYHFTKEQLEIIDQTLQPEVLRLGLQPGDSGYPVQFQKDNIDTQRALWLTVNINEHSYLLDRKENIDKCIAQLSSAAENVASEHAEQLRDSFLLMASQTLPNSLQYGKNNLAIKIQEQTGADLKGSITPSSVTIKDVKPSAKGYTFTCDLSYNFSYELKLSASESDSAAVKPILKKLGLDEVFSGSIKAQFNADVDTATNSLTLKLQGEPSVTVLK